jgi:hypothetical protein
MPTADDRPMPITAPTMAPAQRIGDAERERATSALSEHFAVGRLDHVELDARLEAAYRATTLDQLVALFADLPEPAPFRLNRRDRRAAARAARGAPGWQGFPVVPVIALFVVVGVLIASQGHAFFPLLMMWFWLGAGRRRWYHR